MKKTIIFLLTMVLVTSICYAQTIVLTPNNFTIQMYAGETITKDIIAIWDGNKAINAILNVSIEARSTDTIGFEVSYPSNVFLKPNLRTKIPIKISTKPNLVPDTFFITIKAEANPPRAASFSATGGNVKLFRINNIEIAQITRIPLIWYGNVYYYLYKGNISRISGNVLLTFEGNVKINKTISYPPGTMNLTFNQPVIASVSLDRIVDCDEISRERVYCRATGYAIITPKGSCYADYDGAKIFTNCKIGYNINRIDNLTFEIKENKISLEGRNEDYIFKISDMILTWFNVFIL